MAQTKNKKKLGLNMKLSLQSLVLALVTAAVGILGYLGSQNLVSSMESVYEHNVQGVEAIQAVNIEVLNLRVALLKHNLWDDAASKASFEKDFAAAYERLGTVMTEFGKKDLDEKERNIFNVLSAGISDYHSAGVNQYFPASRSLDKAAAQAVLNGTMLVIFNKSIKETATQLMTLEADQAKMYHDKVKSDAAASLVGLAATTGFGILLSLILAWFIGRSISKPVSRLVNSLADSTAQIAVSSTHLSGASQEIARGASEQASQIEETSAAMEELSSMVRQNVQNAQEASALADQSLTAAQTGYQEMQRMEAAMSAIAEATGEIQNIIDVIEDIAGQTKMLALNAAVEAARAGEAGLGFAVVADEVKNLANRSAQSSKDTARMIKDSIRKINEGTEITRSMAQGFNNILDNSRKVRQVTQDVELAGKQQDDGIGQVNKAIIEFDTVVQNNASSSEETASAAEELQGQVDNLNAAIGSLYNLIQGKVWNGQADAGISQDDRPLKAAAGTKPIRPVRTSPVIAAGAGTARSHRISFETDEEFV